MGSVTGLLGFGGGQQGTGVAAPGSYAISNPTTQGQINTAYTGTQDALSSQQALLQALQGQNGLGNQSQVYNQLQGVVSGTGPNPAQAQLAQATGQNVANQAALAAGQRGAAGNVGLMSRQAAMQGNAAQQNSAGQAATLQAQQSLNALNSAGTLANTQATNQIGQTNANTSAQQAEQQALINAQLGINNAGVSQQSGINAANAGLTNTTLQGQQSVLGGILQGAGVGAASGKAKGGMISMADGGPVEQAAFGPQSSFGQFLNQVQVQAPQIAGQEFTQDSGGSGSLKSGVGSGLQSLGGAGASSAGPMAMAGGADAADLAGVAMVAARGGQVPILVSPGEKYLSPQQVEQVKRGADPMKVGQTIPGKPKVGGAKNSYANDFVPMKAEAGGIVVPRSETQSKNPDRNSADFVRKTLAKKKVGK